HQVDRRPRLLRFLDGEMGGRLANAMTHAGIRLRLECRHHRVERAQGGLTCTLSSGETVVTEAVLVAAGRVGNTVGLGLEAAGIEVDERGYVAGDGDFRTGVP